MLESENSNEQHVEVEPSNIKLKVCNLAECEACCCYDGVYLFGDEEHLIKALVDACPNLFSHLPETYMAHHQWGEHVYGMKTTTVPHPSTKPDFPAHFTKTRCAFLTKDHLCSLQVASVKLGFHKWTFKPRACWEFPLEFHQDSISPPPLPDEPDPSYVDENYPGYIHYTPCGKHHPDGAPWTETLHEEISYIKQNPSDLSWHRYGLTLDEIIELARARYLDLEQA